MSDSKKRTHNLYRIEEDGLGRVEVPEHALYGAQTQRAVNNFPISGLTMPRGFIRALGLIKASYAEVNGEQRRLPNVVAVAVMQAAERVAAGEFDIQFPVDVFQTGSGTSSNMNANEVIAKLASAATGSTVHPNDQVNLGQSSNDVIPSATHLAAVLALQERLFPNLAHLQRTLENRIPELQQVVKSGRTHLMDAMPVTFAQEMGGWLSQLRQCHQRIAAVQPRLRQLALGGTAVGTGINAPSGLAVRVCERLSERCGMPLQRADNYFAALSAQDTLVELSGQLKVLAVALVKISNDLRWSGSGPLAGLAEIGLPQLQPGSSIMPGKVNPVIPEAVIMACYQVIGNDTAITLGGQSGNFQLNVTLPLLAHNLLQSIELLANCVLLLANKVLAGLEVNAEHAAATLARNPILITALNERIGYELGVKIAKLAYAEGRPLLEVALEHTDINADELQRLLDPLLLTRSGA